MSIVIPVPENTNNLAPGSIKVILTHEGKFHQDEATACVLLRKTQRFKNYQVIRSRNSALFTACEIVIDIGGTYDHSELRYDHHQRGFEETMTIGTNEYKTKLSSAGLVYRHYGREVIQSALGVEPDDPIVDVLYNKMYESFIEAVDGEDNGISRYPQDIEPLYKSTGTDLGSRIGGLNPFWNTVPQPEKTDMDAAFEKAMALAEEAFFEKLSYYAHVWWPGRSIVAEAMADRLKCHSSGQIIYLKQFCPWKLHLLELEEETGASPPILYAVWKTPPQPTSQYMIGCVPKQKVGFGDRKSLPKAWRGLRDEELSHISGIPDGVFIHASGFLGGNKTYEGAVAIAAAAVDIVEEEQKQ